MTWLNLTPHVIVIDTSQGRIELNSNGLARVISPPAAQRGATPMGSLLAEVAIYEYPEHGRVAGLPDPSPGTNYIVSLIVLAACPGRTDVFAPGTGPNDGAVRNDKGHVVAVTRLIAAPPAPKVTRLTDEQIDSALAIVRTIAAGGADSDIMYAIRDDACQLADELHAPSTEK